MEYHKKLIEAKKEWENQLTIKKDEIKNLLNEFNEQNKSNITFEDFMTAIENFPSPEFKSTKNNPATSFENITKAVENSPLKEFKNIFSIENLEQINELNKKFFELHKFDPIGILLPKLNDKLTDVYNLTTFIKLANNINSFDAENLHDLTDSLNLIFAQIKFFHQELLYNDLYKNYLIIIDAILEKVANTKKEEKIESIICYVSNIEFALNIKYRNLFNAFEEKKEFNIVKNLLSIYYVHSFLANSLSLNTIIFSLLNNDICNHYPEHKEELLEMVNNFHHVIKYFISTRKLTETEIIKTMTDITNYFAVRYKCPPMKQTETVPFPDLD